MTLLKSIEPTVSDCAVMIGVVDYSLTAMKRTAPGEAVRAFYLRRSF